MKMNFKTMAIAAVAAMIGMSACSKESGNDNPADEQGSGSVSLSFSMGAKSRAVAEPAEAEAVNFKNGYVIFTNSLGIINKVTTIVDATATPPTTDELAAGSKVTIAALKATGGAEIKNVPNSSTTVYIAGNLPTGVAAPTMAENISSIKNRAIAIASQSNTAGDVADVTLFSSGATITTHPTITGAKYALVDDVNAIAARIEIGAVSYVNATTNFITGFKIDGIFVNYYYPSMSLASVASTALVNNAPDDNAEADTWYAAASTKYSAALAPLYDYNATTGLGYALASPAVGFSAADPGEATDENVWAYNVLAPKSADGTTVAALEAPHIIVRLSGITTKDDGALPAEKIYKTTQYLTVKFKNKSTGEFLTSFAPGYIYYVTNLTFDESNLTDVPEEELATVWVEAVLMDWTRQEVDYGF